MQVVVEALLQAAQTVVIGADVAKHLRGQLVVGIEALELFLEVDALQVQRLHPRDGRRIQLAGDPGEVSGGVEARIDLMLGGEAVGGSV